MGNSSEQEVGEIGKTYRQINSGDVDEMKHGEVGSLACCDCGLVHKYTVKIKGKTVGITWERDDRATAQVRKWAGIRIIKASKKVRRR